MDYFADYLRDQAVRYRELADAAEDLSRKEELLSLATVCEEVAANTEDRHPGDDENSAFLILLFAPRAIWFMAANADGGQAAHKVRGTLRGASPSCRRYCGRSLKLDPKSRCRLRAI